MSAITPESLLTDPIDIQEMYFWIAGSRADILLNRYPEEDSCIDDEACMKHYLETDMLYDIPPNYLVASMMYLSWYKLVWLERLRLRNVPKAEPYSPAEW